MQETVEILPREGPNDPWPSGQMGFSDVPLRKTPSTFTKENATQVAESLAKAHHRMQVLL